MALPQTIDPSTLNISGKPTMATANTPMTSAGSPGMQSPRIEDVKNEVSPALGALFGGMLGYAADNRGSANSGSGGSGSGASGAGGSGGSSSNPLGSLLTDLIKKATSGSGSSSTPTGNIGNVNSVTFPAGTTQETIDAQYGKTGNESNVVISGVNPGNGEIIATPNYNIGGGNLSGSGSATGNQTEPSGGGYDPSLADTEQYYTNSNGDIYDYSGNLVFAYNNGYYMDPIDYSMYDALTFEPVEDGSVYSEFFDIPTFDSSGTTTLDGYDFADYSPSDWGSFWVKDGGSINKGGLPTPLFANGGGVKRFADGGTSFTDQVVANQVPVATAANTSTTDTSSSSFGDLISGLLSNKTLTGAGLGALLTQLINSNSTQPVNKGVDMTALGTLKPRTTPVGGAAKFVPYSEYGTPTTPYDYSTLYNNLGVSPFGGSTGAVTPTLSPTAPVTAPTTPTAPVTTPTGGLPTTTTPTAPTGTTPVAPASPLYYTDADGNIYDADGNLVWDSTTSTAVPTAGTAASPVAPSSALGTLSPTGSGDSYYSYGTAVTPSSVLGAKKGGSIKMADGGLSDLAVTSLYDATNPDYVQAHEALISQPGMASMNNQFGTVGYNMAYNSPEADAFYQKYGITDDEGRTYISPEGFAYLYSQAPDAYDVNSIVQEMPTETPLAMGNPYDDSTDFPIRTMTDTPLPYERATTTNAPIEPFSTSPTFKFSGANNPLLTGLSQRPAQPFTFGSDGRIVGNYADGGYVPSFSTPAAQLAYSSSMRDPSIPYSSGVVSTPGTVARGGYRPPSARPVTPTMPAQNNNYLNSQYLNTWQKSFPGYRAPALDGKGYIGGPFQIYGRPFAEGGDIGANIPVHTNQNIPRLINGRNDYREGGNYVEGPGDGQSDDIPAMLADGEYVIDAETVAQLGNGSNKAGAKILDEFRENIRAHKRSAPTHKIPPKSKSALAYLKGAK